MASQQRITLHTVVRLGMELALAVNDYNAGLTESCEEIVKLTVAYLAAVKSLLAEGRIMPEDVSDYFALIGQSWGSVNPRFENEYLAGSGSGSGGK